MEPKHRQGLSCEKCEKRALELHETMQYVWHEIKKEFPDCHIAEAWRSEEQQNLIYEKGLSLVKWPLSRHNRMRGGLPCAEAMDLFELRDGKAHFNMNYYQSIYLHCQKLALPIEAGCTWRFADGPHFQLK